VDRAKELFRLASKQVAALAAEEAAQQIAAARDLANDIALQTAPTESKQPGAGSGEKGKLPGLGNAAEQAKTLKDVMEQIAGRPAEEAADAARKVGPSSEAGGPQGCHRAAREARAGTTAASGRA
jgi:hypothetical protein